MILATYKGIASARRSEAVVQDYFANVSLWEIHTPSEKMGITAQPKAVRKLKILNKFSCLVINAPAFNSLLPRRKAESRVALQNG